MVKKIVSLDMEHLYVVLIDRFRLRDDPYMKRDSIVAYATLVNDTLIE